MVFRSSWSRGGQQFIYKVFKIFQCFSSPEHNKSSFILTFSVLRAFMVGEKKLRQNGSISPRFSPPMLVFKIRLVCSRHITLRMRKITYTKSLFINIPYRLLPQPSYNILCQVLLLIFKEIKTLTREIFRLLMPPMIKNYVINLS